MRCVPVPGGFGSGSCEEKAGKVNYLVGLSKIFDINENDLTRLEPADLRAKLEDYKLLKDEYCLNNQIVD